jgi:hypothetical protein
MALSRKRTQWRAFSCFPLKPWFSSGHNRLHCHLHSGLWTMVPGFNTCPWTDNMAYLQNNAYCLRLCLFTQLWITQPAFRKPRFCNQWSRKRVNVSRDGHFHGHKRHFLMSRHYKDLRECHAYLRPRIHLTRCGNFLRWERERERERELSGANLYHFKC